MSSASSSRPAAATHLTGDVDWYVCWVERGSCRLGFGEDATLVESGDLAVASGLVPVRPLPRRPKPVLHQVTLPLSWVERWRLPEQLFQAVMQGTVVRCPVADADIAPLAARLRREQTSLRPTRQRAIGYELRALLWYVADWFERQVPKPARNGSPPRHHTAATTLVRELIGDLARPFSLPAVARATGLSPARAGTMFRETYGMTMREFLARQRIQKAQELLAETELKVIDVAHACGFNTSSRFYAAFERYCGVPPASFRASPKWRRATNAATTTRSPGRDAFGAGSCSTPPAALSTHRVVLWVDDVPANNLDERLRLLDRGIACETCTDNASALAALARFGFAALITDLTRFNRPETGWHLIAAVQKTWPELPVYIFTDRVTPRLTARARRAGVAAIFCRSRELLDAVARSVASSPAPAKAGDLCELAGGATSTNRLS